MAQAKPGDLLLALSLLSRLPTPAPRDWSRQAEAAWAYPLVGALLGGAAALVGMIGAGVGLPVPLVALVVLAALIVMSGAMHEDGLADCADGFWGGWDRERRLAIMKDSQIGSYGVVALMLGIAARWTAIWAIWEAGGAAEAVPAILAAAILSRAAMPVLMHALPHARDTGLSQRVGRVPRHTALWGLALALGLSFALLGFAAFWAAVCAALVLVGLSAVARHKIGGQTGDVLGASQQLTEIAVLLALAA